MIVTGQENKKMDLSISSLIKMIHKKMLDENIKKHKGKVVYLFLSLEIFINFF